MTTEADKSADLVVNTMMTGMVAAATVPGPVNWAAIAAALGGGVVSIGLCYGVQLNRDEAWKLVKQFIFGAGFTFLSLGVGTKILSALLAVTGAGYVASAAMEAALGAAIAYGVGGAAKAYFKGERDKRKLGEIFKSRLKEKMAI